MHHAAHPHAPEHEPQPRTRLLPVLLVAQLMVILDITAVNIAMPSIATDLEISGTTSAGRSPATRSSSAACCCSAAAPPTCSAAAACSSPASASSPPRPSLSAMAGCAAALFAARAGQGLGAAMLSPAALSIITTTFHGQQRAKALAAWGAVGGAGAAIGVLLGGVLTQLADWRMIFFVNLPVAVALAVAAPRSFPPTRRSRAGRASTFAAPPSPPRASPRSSTRSRRPTRPAGPRRRRSSSAPPASPASPLFAVCERRTEQPLLRIERLRDRAVGGGLLLMLLRRRADLRAVPALLALPPARRSATALSRPASPSFRSPSPRGRRPRRRPPDQPPRRPRTARGRVRDRGRRPAAALPARPHGNYLHDILPGMLIAGFGLGVAAVCDLGRVLTGARAEESRHALRRSTPPATRSAAPSASRSSPASPPPSAAVSLGPAAAAGIADAFLVAAHLAAAASAAALVVLPAARTFLAEAAAQPSGDASPLTSLRTQHPGTRRAPETAPSAAGCVGRFRGARAQRRRAVSRSMCDSFSGLRTA